MGVSLKKADLSLAGVMASVFPRPTSWRAQLETVSKLVASNPSWNTLQWQLTGRQGGKFTQNPTALRKSATPWNPTHSGEMQVWQRKRLLRIAKTSAKFWLGVIPLFTKLNIFHNTLASPRNDRICSLIPTNWNHTTMLKKSRLIINFSFTEHFFVSALGIGQRLMLVKPECQLPFRKLVTLAALCFRWLATLKILQSADNYQRIIKLNP